MENLEDLEIVVLGSGPAGGTAALFSAKVGLRVAVLSGNPTGSLIIGAKEIDNFPGFEVVSGLDLIRSLKSQCQKAGVTWLDSCAAKVFVENRKKVVFDDQGRRILTRALIIAVGTEPIIPKIPGVERFFGKGVSLCAWCDGSFFNNKRVAILGGGNSAFSSAALLSRNAKEVFLLLPHKTGSAFLALKRQVGSNRKIHLLPRIDLLSVKGDSKVEEINLVSDGNHLSIPIDGLFLALGQTPRTSFLKETIEVNSSGFIKADSRGRTNVPGIFAAGDVVEGNFRQLVVACGSGATASLSCDEYLSNQWG